MTKWRTFIDPSVGDGQNTINGIIADGSTFGVGISSNLSVSGLSTFSDIARFSSTIRLDGQLRDGDNNFGSSGQVLSSDGTDTRWINAAQLSAGAASQVAVNDDSNTNAERFITIVDSSSGNNNIKTDASLKYNPSTNTITTVNITGNVTGNVTGNLSGNVTGDASGNSGTATVLQTSRTIGGVSFDGSANINLPGVNQAGNQNTSGNAATATKLATARNIGGVSFDGSAAINLPGVNQTGNQNTSGNAATATVLATSRNFSISGEITANAQSFNGSGNLTLNATVDNNIIDEANLKVSNNPVNGYFLQAQSGDSGGLRWSQVTVPSSNTLSGTTLASGITASSITSLGTLNSLSVSGTVDINDTITLNAKNEDPSHDKGVIIIQPSASGGRTGINFRSKVNADSDHGYLWWYDDNDNYNVNSSANSENGALVLGAQNDFANTTGDVVAVESAGNIFLNPGLGDNNYGGSSGPNFSQGKVYIGRASTKYQVWHEGNDGPSSGLDADKLDNQEGSYYRNASNLNDGTIPNARLTNSSLFVTGMIIIWNGAQNAIPSGWVICDGNNNTPDLRNRFIIGAGSGGSYSPGDTGGAASVTLSVAQMPSHSHSTNSHAHSFSGNTAYFDINHTHGFSGSNTHNHSFTGVYGNDHNDNQRRAVVMRNDRSTGYFTAAGGSGVQNATITISGDTGGTSANSNHRHSFSGTTGGEAPNTNNDGGGQSHENRPPYYALCYIMKT